MAIARTRRPRLMVTGVVTAVRDMETKDKSRIWGHDVTVDQDGGALLAVTIFVNDNFDPKSVPSVGTVWAAWVSVQESPQYGASLAYEGDVTPGDLDLIHSGSKAAT